MSAAHTVGIGGEHLEDLGSVRRGPRRHADGPAVSWRALAHLCGLAGTAPLQGSGSDAGQGSDVGDEGAPTTIGALSEADRAALARAGWLTDAGDLGPRGRELADGLGESRTVIRLQAWHRGELQRGWVVVGEDTAVTAYETEPAPSEQAPPGGVTFDVTPVNGLPIVLAKWGGLSPTWNYDTAHEVSDASLVRRRVHNVSAPAPAGGDPDLIRLWGDDWTLWSVRCEAIGVDLEFLAIGAQGQYVLRTRTDGATVLAPRPGSLLWGDLQLVLTKLPGLPGRPVGDGDDW